MANNQWQNSSKFDISIPFTQRKLTSVKSEANLIVITTISQFPATVVAKTSTRAGSFINLYDCGSWANGGPYEVISRSTNVLKLRKSGLASGKTFAVLPTSQAKVSTNTGAESFTEIRKTAFSSWNESLTATTTLCGLQVKVKDILNKFWSDAEVVLQFKARYKTKDDSGGDWSTYGPILMGDTSSAYGFNKDRFLNAYLCTVFAESTWNRNANNGSYYGLFQIGTKAGAGWSDSGFLSNIYDAEYNTRCAIWLMYQRLFQNTSNKLSNPYRDWEGAKSSNTNYINCCSGVRTCSTCKKYCNCANCTGIN